MAVAVKSEGSLNPPGAHDLKLGIAVQQSHNTAITMTPSKIVAPGAENLAPSIPFDLFRRGRTLHQEIYPLLHPPLGRLHPSKHQPRHSSNHSP
jgi:hypothetical protein